MCKACEIYGMKRSEPCGARILTAGFDRSRGTRAQCLSTRRYVTKDNGARRLLICVARVTPKYARMRAILTAVNNPSGLSSASNHESTKSHPELEQIRTKITSIIPWYDQQPSPLWSHTSRPLLAICFQNTRCRGIQASHLQKGAEGARKLLPVMKSNEVRRQCCAKSTEFAKLQLIVGSLKTRAVHSNGSERRNLQHCKNYELANNSGCIAPQIVILSADNERKR